MKRDIPKVIAGILWAGGAVWAALLLIFSLIGLPMFMFPPLFFGSLVWFGWLWRSQRLRPKIPAMGVWIISLVVNGWWLLPHDSSRELPSFPYLGWWLFAVTASAVALICEIWIDRDEHASERGASGR
jgi:hypothetical protein